ncbi:hypothetical protein HUW48_14445 [Adhaeribacter radiodurans]|uniref:Uncharacterized protein n=1 Tax=Adhaeribacter radiodurans TaxID=2745197 RepID=A0A7L7L9G2_9BACT|nr:hypothetical protein HUW48_14445 [Adhaeribacter radiodurans]
MDRRPEFIASLMTEWSQLHGIKFLLSNLASPPRMFVSNGLTVLSAGMYSMLTYLRMDEGREITTVWLEDYNY